MDQAKVVTLTLNKEDRQYVFSMPYGATYGEAYDSAYAMLCEIMEMSKRNTAKAERKVEESDLGDTVKTG